MQFCKKCNTELKSDWKVCLKCGAPNPGFTETNNQDPDNENIETHNTVKRSSTSYGSIRLEDLPEGFIVDDRYEVKRKLGQGGFGAVYLVFDRDMNIDKALKVIPEAIVNDKEAMYDLQKEAQTMISLNHPNIVRVYDFHKTGSIKYIDMEFIDGKTLTDIKLEHPKKQIQEDDVKAYAVKIAEGLAYAHSKNVIHKDIKPQNIMITSRDEVKIMDFGIAETVRTSMSRIQNTSSSGTLVYMSPEQLLGKDVGKESDIYSFGAMLYELLSGHPPFYKGDINYQILHVEPERIENVAKEINSIILKCLHKDYRKRHTNIDEIVQELGGSHQKYKKIKKEIPYPEKSTGIFKKLVPISIVTEPRNAIVYLDGKRQEELTPVNTKHIIGEIPIKIEKEGYETIKDVIEISEGSTNNFYIELVSKKNSIIHFIRVLTQIQMSFLGSIYVLTDEPGYDIWLNGCKTEFRTPHTFENIIPDKEYTIQINHPHFLSKKEKIKISKFEDRKILLSSILGSVTIETEEPGQTILLNGKVTVFHTPHTFKRRSPGKYKIELISEKYYLPETEITLNEKENKIFKPDLKKYSFLRVTSNYHEITFEVDGIKINANEKVRLKPGKKIIKPSLEFLPSLEVSVSEGELITYNFDENIPSKKLLLNAGNYDKKVKITSPQNNKREESKFKGNKTFLLLPGIYGIKVKHKSLTKTFKIDLQQEDQEINIFHEIEIIERKKKRKITFISLPIFTLILIISSIKITSGIKESKSWNIAKTTNTSSSYGDYIAQYPKGKYIKEAKNIDESLTWEKAKSINSIISYSDYITKYPNGKHNSEIFNKFPFLRSFIFVKGGTFRMGGKDGNTNEKPVHTVTVSDFYIGKYEVTQKEWKEIMGNNPSHFKGDNLPVEYVSWYDAVEFCNKKSEKEGLTPCYSINKKTKDINNKSKFDDLKWIVSCNFSANGYRLPTEAEWEYAARGGNKSKGYKYSGSNRPNEVAFYSKNSGRKTHPVGHKKANELGIYDMSGNVLEWCNDWYDSNYYSSSPRNNPKGPSSSSFRAIHGGGWDSILKNARSAYRGGASPDYSRRYIGFRLARTL